MSQNLKHSPEPWTVIGRVENPPVMIRDANGDVFTISVGGVHSEKALSIIYRMVECLNACQGINTKQ